MTKKSQVISGVLWRVSANSVVLSLVLYNAITHLGYSHPRTGVVIFCVQMSAPRVARSMWSIAAGQPHILRRTSMCTSKLCKLRLSYEPYTQRRRRDLVQRGTQNYMKLFVAHKVTRNNTPNKVRVAATDLSQLLSQNPNLFG